MQETEFITQNRKKWQDFEQEVGSKERDPEKLLDLFVQTTDDLSYSRTHYGNRTVRFYLNGIARDLYHQLYKNKRSEKNAFLNFWKIELPFALYQARAQLRLSMLIMLAGLAIGLVSCMYYPNFAAVILSEGYVEMTEQLIAEGNPLGVYGLEKDPMRMFLEIAWNNIQYAFGAFVFGIVCGIGTVYALLTTGIMVGAFAYFFIARGLFKQFFLAVMLHGTLELGMITIAGGAGLLLARAVLFPGSYTRLESLINSARQSMHIMLAVSLFLLYAALIEGFLTRHTDASDWARLGLILVSAAILIGYFVWYPLLMQKRGAFEELKNKKSVDRKPLLIRWEIVKNAGDVIAEMYVVLFNHFALIWKKTWLYPILAGALAMLILQGEMHLLDFQFESNPGLMLWPWESYAPFYDIKASWFHFFASVSVLGLTLWSIMRGIQLANGISFLMTHQKLLMRCISGALIIMTGLQVPSQIRELVAFLLVPYVLFTLVVCAVENCSLLTSFVRSVRLIFAQLGVFIMFWLAVMAMNYLVLLFTDSILLAYVSQFIIINIPITMAYSQEMPYVLTYIFLGYSLLVVYALTLVGMLLFYHSAMEVTTARTLLSRIQRVGQRKNIYGLEREDEK
jgi:uncharacterized membrane protein SpoIIM required for sporulation